MLMRRVPFQMLIAASDHHFSIFSGSVFVNTFWLVEKKLLPALLVASSVFSERDSQQDL